ncbi:MAG: MFS transporter [Clostridia bacterium]|nr:MFS transporter [Clostridia bacterium]
MKLNYKRTIFVGFAFFLICAFWQAYDTIIPKILTDKFGMSQTASGAIMALDNVLALFMLPLFGAISDKCKSRLGRRTPFILIGTIVAAIMFVGLSFVDNMQLTRLDNVKNYSDKQTLEYLYDYDYKVKNSGGVSYQIVTPDGEKLMLKEAISREDFTSISLQIPKTDKRTGEVVIDSKTGEPEMVTNPAYTKYVIPARQAYAWQVTAESPMTLVFFMVLLLLTLVAMSIFRSPAVALMPDVTVKPLRSKANAVINLMGSCGGIVVLALGIVFGTGNVGNDLMSYVPFFITIAAIMLISLAIFMAMVREPQFVKEKDEDTVKYGVMENEAETAEQFEGRGLTRGEKISLILILASVVLWFMGYNAVSSKYSVYASNELKLDYNLTLIVGQAAAILAYLPVGFLSSKIGRKKAILLGIVILFTAVCSATFMTAQSPAWFMNIIFALAGIGWATINVNSFPMVVELSKSGNVGKYTGFYYTASMAAQTVTPILSGYFMDSFGLRALFPYASVFVALAFVTMLFVKHGDSKPAMAQSVLEQMNVED